MQSVLVLNFKSILGSLGSPRTRKMLLQNSYNEGGLILCFQTNSLPDLFAYQIRNLQQKNQS